MKKCWVVCWYAYILPSGFEENVTKMFKKDEEFTKNCLRPFHCKLHRGHAVLAVPKLRACLKKPVAAILVFFTATGT